MVTLILKNFTRLQLVERRSVIAKLSNESNESVTNHSGMYNIAKEYFVNLFGPNEVLQEEELEVYDVIVTNK